MSILRNRHERSPGIDVYNASAALCSHHWNHRLHCDDWSQNVEMEDFVKNLRFDLLYCGRIATARIIYEPVDTAVVLVYGAYRFPHSIELRHVNRERKTAWKLLCQFLQRIRAASKEGDLPAPLRQSYAVERPMPDEAPVTMNTRSLISMV
jgi:hypothetical protein